MTPAVTVPEVVADLGQRGTKVAVVLSAGISAANGLKQQILDAAQPHLLRVIGPNTIGLLAPRVSLNASFVHIAPNAGRLGLISQSGAMVSSIVDWAVAEGIGFSQIYSLGDMLKEKKMFFINFVFAFKIGIGLQERQGLTVAPVRSLNVFLIQLTANIRDASVNVGRKRDLAYLLLQLLELR